MRKKEEEDVMVNTLFNEQREGRKVKLEGKEERRIGTRTDDK